MFSLGDVLKSGKQILKQQGAGQLNQLKHEALGRFHGYKKQFEKATGPQQQAELAEQAWKSVSSQFGQLAGGNPSLQNLKSLADRKKNALGTLAQGFTKDPGRLQDALHDLPLLLQGAEEKATREVAQRLGPHLAGINKLDPGSLMGEAETFLNKSFLPLAEKLGTKGLF